MKVMGYVRVSTDKQVEKGLGLEVQEAGIRAWAKASGHLVSSICRDKGVSGAIGLETRLGLAEALEALRTKEVHGLVVYRLDRLARDLVLQEQLLAEIRRLGGTPFSTDGGESTYLEDNPDEPSRRLIRQVLGAVSEYERSMIALRLRLGRRRKQEKGGYAYGSPPYGWKSSHGVLLKNPAEQRGIRIARRLRRQGWTLSAIGDELEARGITPRRGARWHPTTVRRLLPT